MNAVSGTNLHARPRPAMPPLALLLGGRATRLYPLTEQCPKALVPVAGEPFLAHQLRWLAGQGITQLVLCCGHLAEPIRSFAGDGRGFGVEIRYSDDGATLLGTGGAVRKALPLLGDCFAVLYGDTLLTAPLAPVWQSFLERRPGAMMTVLKNHDRWDQSNVAIEDGWVKRYQKGATQQEDVAQGKADRAGLTYIDYGFSIFDARVFTRSMARSSTRLGATANGPCDLGQVFCDLIAQRDLAACEVEGRFYEMGSPAGLRETEARLLREPWGASKAGCA